jgi:hypothetical protein
MGEIARPVAVSDALISALSERRRIDSADPVLQSLEAWVQRIDAVPMAPWTQALPPVAKTARPVQLVRRVAALTLVLTVSSSGLATAVTGDPWSSLHFVKREIRSFGSSDARRPPEGPGGITTDPVRGSAPEVSRSLMRPPVALSRRAGSHVVRHSPSP